MDIEKQLERDVSIDVPFALQSLRPGAQWVLRGSEFTGLEWLDEEQSQPSEQDIVDEIERLKLLKVQLKYRRDRLDEYLPLTEQLDLLYWDGVNGTTDWSDHVAGVKANHPKPE
jgi:hypothetical protein